MIWNFIFPEHAHQSNKLKATVINFYFHWLINFYSNWELKFRTKYPNNLWIATIYTINTYYHSHASGEMSVSFFRSPLLRSLWHSILSTKRLFFLTARRQQEPRHYVHCDRVTVLLARCMSPLLNTQFLFAHLRQTGMCASEIMGLNGFCAGPNCWFVCFDCRESSIRSLGIFIRILVTARAVWSLTVLILGGPRSRSLRTASLAAVR